MIIGHRGAGKLAPENSLEGFKIADDLHLLAVEIDVQMTKDKKFVLAHDGTFDHNGKLVVIAKQLQSSLMKKGLLSLEQALNANRNRITIIDIKVWDSAQCLVPFVTRRKQNIRFTGSNLPDIQYCKEHLPKHFAYISENKNPFRAVRRADKINADGLSLKWFLINPITYWQARRRGLEIMLYTLNSRLVTRLIAFLYPDVSICTDRPDRFARKRYNW